MPKPRSPISLVADFHHEIRSPVNTILNMAELALEHCSESMLENYLRVIKRSARQLLTMLDDVVELADSTDASGVKDHFSLPDVLEQVHSSVKGLFSGRNAFVVLEVPEELPLDYEGYGLKLRQLLIQLLNIALRDLKAHYVKLCFDYDAKGEGHLVVSLEVQSLEEIAPKLSGNIRLLVCRQALEDMGHSLLYEMDANRVKFVFKMEAQEVQIHRRPLLEKPVCCCILCSDNFSRTLMALRLRTCGFKVLEAQSLPEAIKVVEAESRLNGAKPIILNAWSDFPFKGEPTRWREMGINIPLLLFDIPPMDMLAIGKEDFCLEKAGKHMGFAMELAKGRHILLEVTRLLGLEGAVFPCISSKEEDFHKLQIEKLKDKRILVVEDDKINQKIIVQMLKEGGVKPVVASNAKAALIAIERYEFSAVLMDINLPDMNGFSLTHRIRSTEKGKNIPIIALTSSTKDRQRCLEAGMNEFIAKPYKKSVIFSVLSSLV